MSGHSKWSTIKRQKEATDKKKGATFTKLSRAITIAIRQSGGDASPESNFRLRLAIEKARAANMPKENITRAIERASGNRGGEGLEEITYEGYGPSGVGIIVQVATDNKQRTGQEIRNIFDRSGGSLASPGSVSYNFDPFGQLIVTSIKPQEKAILELIDLGVEDVEITASGIEVFVQPAHLSATREKIAAAGYNIIETENILHPKATIAITDGHEAKKVIQLLETLEQQDDVQQVFTNADLPAA